MVVRTSPAVAEDDPEGAADSEGGAVVVPGASGAVLVATTVSGGRPVSVVVSALAVVGPMGTGVATPGEVADSGGEADSGVDGDGDGAGGTGEVPLSWRLAKRTIEDARLASSR